MDWAGRTTNLCEFMTLAYGLPAQDTRILAACLLPCDPARPVWPIINSRPHLLWDDLDWAIRELGLPRLANLTWIRAINRPRCNNFIEGCTEKRNGRRLLLDTYGDQDMHIRANRLIPELLSECIWLRSLPSLTVPPPGARERLLELLQSALEVGRIAAPVPAKAPDLLIHYARLATVLNPQLSNGPLLMHSLCLLASSLALLDGRDKLDRVDWFAVRRVLLDSIRRWTYLVLLAFSEKTGALTINDLAVKTSLTRHFARVEVSRLIDAGILHHPDHPDYTINIAGGHYPKWIDLHPAGAASVRTFILGEAVWW